MSSNIIDISSEDEAPRKSPLKVNAVHTVSSSDNDSSSEVAFPTKVASTTSRKQYKIPKVSQSKDTPSKSLSSSEEFPSPSKIDVFKSISRHKRDSSKNTRDSDKSRKSNRKRNNNTSKKLSRSSSSSSEKYTGCGESSRDKPNLDDSLSSIKSHTISDSNSDSSVSPLHSPITKKKKKTKPSLLEENKIRRDKEKIAEEKRQKKKEEAEAKEKKKKIAENLRKFKPGECLKHLTTRLDVSITQESYGNDVLTNLDSLETKYEIIHQSLPSTVSWIRDGSNGNEEDLLLIIWSGEHFVKLVAEIKSVDEINKFKKTFPGKRIILVVFGFEYYMNKLKKDKCSKSTKLSPELKYVTKAHVEMAMIQLQFLCRCNCKLLETRADVALHVSQLTKSIAEMPFRLERQKLEEKSDWHANSDSKDCVKVDKLGNGLGRLWRQQIRQFNKVTLDISEAIAQVYKTPTSLVKAYEVCSTRREREKLLADIMVRKGRGPSASTRTVGKELSRKIYYLFNSTDPEQPLSQPQDM